MDVLLGLSNEHAYFKGRAPVPCRELPHDPWFWAIPTRSEGGEAARARVVKAWEQAKRDLGGAGEELHPLQKIKDVGRVQSIKSFTRWGETRPAFPVYARRSHFVPDISDELFGRHNLFTAEHDVPYQQRVTVDLAAGQYEVADGRKPAPAWAFDTHGAKTKLRVLVYDIETTQWQQRKSTPVDMLGWGTFEVAYRASKDLDKEEFDFELVDEPPDWRSVEILQDEARTPDEEVKLLLQFVRRVPDYDIVSGHNILGFDNREVYDRIQGLLEADRAGRTLSTQDRRAFEEFTQKWAARDRTFTFGQQAETVNFHPTSFDTLHAARRFFFFLDDFGLKRLAPYMGVVVPNRVYLSAHELKVGDAKTRLYNKHDVMEQVGVTGGLLAQALPLAFTAGWTFEELLTGGNVRMWDHMGMIRAARARKIMPATCRAQGMARAVLAECGNRATKEAIWTRARAAAGDAATLTRLKEFNRVAKYGDEMPDWVELPHVIVNEKAVAQRRRAEAEGANEDEEEEEYLGYSIPGGMTLHPQELGSHFVPWWHVVTADVGAMYPTILRALNVSADTIRLARKGEEPDDWVWMYRLPDDFVKDERWVFRAPGPAEAYAAKGQGVMVGIKKNPEPGVTAQAMKGVMGIAARVKKLLGTAKKEGKLPKAEIDRLAMMYASLKANRNAGTHGQMLAVNVSCRGFNLWAGGEITTIGQKILADVQGILKSKGARVVYGDSVVGSRCVTVRDPKGRVDVLPIERLFAMVGGERHPWHGKEAVAGNGWEALSMDPSGLVRASAWKPIVRVIRHDAAKRILRVRQPEGETICTEDHSIMAEREGRVERTRPEELSGARLVRAECPQNALKDAIDLAEYLEPLARRLESELGAPRPGGRVNRRTRFGYDDSHIWFSSRGPETRRLKRFISPNTRECEALCRLLGAYVAEGAVNWGPRQGASIANSDRAWLEGLQRDFGLLFEGYECGIVESDRRPGREILLKDGSVTVYKDATLKMQMTTKLASVFFWALAGKGSQHKRVPQFVFNLNSYFQGQFLKAAIEGDGSPVSDPRYTARHRRYHFSYSTKSLELASGMSTILSQMGYDFGIRHDRKKGAHTLFTCERSKEKQQTVCEPWANRGPVYDLEVAETHTFVDAYGGILLHNTDGIYVGCSKSAKNLPEVAKALGVDYEPGAPDSWYILPDDAEAAIQEANETIRKSLNYEAFELEAEHHDAMVFVVHKNYLIFDVKKGQLVMTTKGNNFRGSDKAPVAQRILSDIMRSALKDVLVWEDEETAREAMRAAIKRWTRETLKTFDMSKVEKSELTLIQVVQPVAAYKTNPDGSDSIWMKRAKALEKVTGEKLRASKKYRFVVCKQPLPGIEKPSKTGIKPLDFMWPLDGLQSDDVIDLMWYKDMIEKYVRGAFGLEDLELHAQKGLDAWM